MEGASENELVLVFIAAGLGMLLLAGSIVLFVLFYQKRMLRIKGDQQQKETEYQRDLLLATIQSQEAERKRIARELHDSVGAMLSTVRLNMARAVKLPANERLETDTELKGQLDDTIESVRRISHDLLPPLLEQFGLTRALESMCAKTEKATGVRFAFKSNDFDRLPMDKELALYRIAQELTNNALKHAEASELKLALHQGKGVLQLNFEDNGVGFDMDQHTDGGLGLKNLESRAHMIGAHIEIRSSPNKGTQAKVTSPNDP